MCKCVGVCTRVYSSVTPLFETVTAVGSRTRRAELLCRPPVLDHRANRCRSSSFTPDRGRLCYYVNFASSSFVVCHLQEMEHSVQEIKSMENIQMEPQLSNERTELTFLAVFVRYLIRSNFCSTRTDPASCAVSSQSKISL